MSGLYTDSTLAVQGQPDVYLSFNKFNLVLLNLIWFSGQSGGEGTNWTLRLIVAGGRILGPAVQKSAFGEFWTRIPFGWDLTDKKTLVAAIAWVLAWVSLMISSRHVNSCELSRWIIIGAAAATLVIFALPHSICGSQVDWSKLPKTH